MKTACIYARFSSNNQREESIDAQLRVCHKYADDHDISVIREYTDSAISGRTDQRPSFQRMIEDSAKGEWQLVLVYAHDRFSRDSYDTAVYKNRLKKNGCSVLSVTMPLDDSPESGLMEGIMERFAQYYSENLSRSVKRGLEENALKGLSNGACPLGYIVENHRFAVDPVGSKAVKMIFEMYTEGIGKQQICDTLNERGFKTKQGNQFKINCIHSILSNERYTGVYIYRDTRIENGIPAIISQEMFEKAQKQVESRKHAKGKTKATMDYLLSGKVFCGKCGKPLVGESGKSSTGEIYHYYKCAARKRNSKSCCKATERKDDLESIVLKYVCDEVLTDQFIDEIATECYKQLDEEYQDKSMLISYEAEFKEVSNKIENILEAIEQGIFTPKTKERLLDLEKRQTQLEDLIVIEKLKKPAFTKDHIVFWLSSFGQGNIDDFDFKRNLINSLVNSVFVFDEDKEKGSDRKIVIALNLKNVPVRTLTRSDVQQMVHHFKQNANFYLVKKYLVLFWFSR